MEGKRFIRSIRLESFLSFGAENQELPLEPLNVLVGPNASGKSNLIEAVGLLRAATTDLRAPIARGGGVREWLWKGTEQEPWATIEVSVYYPHGRQALRYRLSFGAGGQRFELKDETIENERSRSGETQPYFFYRYQDGHPVLNIRQGERDQGCESSVEVPRVERSLQREEVKPDVSILAQRRDPDQYPEITYLGDQFGALRLYRELDVGPHSPVRGAQQADLPNDFLDETASNLGLVLNDLKLRSTVWPEIIGRLRQFHEKAEDIDVGVQAGQVQVFVRERGYDRPIPATRLSDGTLRYLCLLAVLCHPAPPPLICVEEPEIGLHPDVFPSLAELLVEAAQRTQLIVTTHSDTLVSALSDVPESILVCEQEEGGTVLRRLDGASLKKWLEAYSLGELWRMGEIGGNRW